MYKSRGVNQTDNLVCSNTVWAVLLELMAMVQDSIKEEIICYHQNPCCFIKNYHWKLMYCSNYPLKIQGSSKGFALIHDGWTIRLVHFLACLRLLLIVTRKYRCAYCLLSQC